MKLPIFKGTAELAYRDPACIYVDGTFYLFMTISRKSDGYMYNTLGLSESRDLIRWTEPRSITVTDRTQNYCSPGNILRVGDEYWICVTSYPMPDPYEVRSYATDDARLFFIKTKDFQSFSAPELILAKGDTPREAMGRMIDPYIFRDRDDDGLYHLFFKQNGVSHAHSRDLIHWEYDGRMNGGENACVVLHDGLYYLIHSPENGIGLKVSKDLTAWEDRGVQTLGQSRWEWASGRITAAFAMEAPRDYPRRYLVFFHGSRADSFPETHGSASIALAATDDFETYML